MVLFTALVTLVSCTKDGEFSNKDIVGTWEAVEEYEKWTIDGEVEEDRYYYEPGEVVWVFNEDGTFQVLSGGSDFDYLKYKVNGTKLVVSEDGVSVAINIKKLDSKEMILSQSGRDGGDSYYTEIVLKKRN